MFNNEQLGSVELLGKRLLREQQVLEVNAKRGGAAMQVLYFQVHEALAVRELLKLVGQTHVKE